MIIRYYSYEEAAIHVGVMRSEGYAAAMLDEVMGSYYGPVFSNGFRVWVSDGPITGEEESEDVAWEPLERPSVLDSSWLWNAVRVVTGALMLCGVVFLGLALVALTIGLLIELKRVLTEGGGSTALVGLGALLGFVILLGLSSLFVVRMTRSLRDESSAFGWTVRGLAAAWVILCLLNLIVMILSVLWQLCGGNPSRFVLP